jgi:hypothetical protein
MITLNEVKGCRECGVPLKGRSDKKFCNDHCRNSFNNTIRSDSNNYIRNINNVLRKNRRILESLMRPGEILSKTKRDKLIRLGFSFDHHTHSEVNRAGKTYKFCYEFGYMQLANDICLVIRKNTER